MIRKSNGVLRCLKGRHFSAFTSFLCMAYTKCLKGIYYTGISIQRTKNFYSTLLYKLHPYYIKVAQINELLKKSKHVA